MRKIKKILYPILIIFTIIILIKFFMILTVRGISMEPTLKDNDIIIIEKLSKYSHSIDRGDIIVFKNHTKERLWVKRVIALEGDTIECKNNIVYVNGEEVNEDYLEENIMTTDISEEKIPEGCMYLLGDNREQSLDSRGVGVINYNDLVGKVIGKFSIPNIS